MKREFLKKMVAISMTTLMVTSLNTITASAKWITNLESNWNYVEGGVKAIGWKYIDNKWYYLNDDGIMLTGWIKYSGDWYSLSNDGSMNTGWKSISGQWYYLESNGKMKTGWYNDNGTWYYMNPSGEMQTGTLTIDGIVYNFSNSGQWLNNQTSTKETTQSGLANDNSSKGSDGTRTAYVTTNSGPLNVREAAAVSSNIIGTVAKGAEIRIVGDEENGFYPLILQGKKGWVSSDWISFANSAGGTTTSATTNTTTNVTSTSSTSSASGSNTDTSQTNSSTGTNSSQSNSSTSSKSQTNTKSTKPQNITLGALRDTAPTTDNKLYYSDDNIFYKVKLSPPFYSDGSPIKGNCTWYAFGRAWEITGVKLDDEVFNGNAYEWWNANIKSGKYQYGSEPRVGAIGVWKSSLPNSTESGHVAIVEKIDNGKVYISESTWNGVTFRYREIYQTSYMYGYIYLDKPNY